MAVLKCATSVATYNDDRWPIVGEVSGGMPLSYSHFSLLEGQIRFFNADQLRWGETLFLLLSLSVSLSLSLTLSPSLFFLLFLFLFLSFFSEGQG